MVTETDVQRMPRYADIKTDLQEGDYFLKTAGMDKGAQYVVLRVCRTYVKVEQIFPVDDQEEFKIDRVSSWRFRSHWKKMGYECL